MPLIITRAGYEPLMLVGEVTAPGPPVPATSGDPFRLTLLPLPTGADSTLHVTIRLRPLAGSSRRTGALSGRITWLGQPVPALRVAVSLGWTDHADTLHALSVPMTPVPDRTAVTDSLGRFVITALVPGWYTIAPAYLANDGYDGTPGLLSFDSTYHVVAPDTLDVGDIAVKRNIELLTPGAGATVLSRTPELRWRAVKPPAGYRVTGYLVWYTEGYRFGLTVGPPIPDTSWTVPQSSPLSAGAHVRWYVEAWGVQEEPGGGEVQIGMTEVPATFQVVPE